MKFDRKIEREGNSKKKNTECKYQIRSYTANSLENFVNFISYSFNVVTDLPMVMKICILSMLLA